MPSKTKHILISNIKIVQMNRTNVMITIYSDSTSLPVYGIRSE